MGVINLVRSLIPQKLPTPLRRWGRWAYSHIPMEKRIGKRYWQLKTFLQEAQWWDRERIEAWQLEKLKEIARHAYENVPGYQSLYREAGIKQEDILTLADIRLLPFTTKELLRDNLADFSARNIPSRQRRYVTTGGSTGIPFGFYHTDVNEWMENAFMHSGWERAGWQMGDMAAVLRGAFVGSEDGFWDYDPARHELLFSSYYLTSRTYSRYIAKLEEFRPKHLQAYPSVATMLADLLLENGDAGRIYFKVILLGSENIYEWQKDKLRKAFPRARLFGWYGQAEQAILAHWCEHSDQYHDWPFYGLTEILDHNNSPVAIGEEGELIGTSFWNYGTPFIRYHTIDMARKGSCGCAMCGRQFYIYGSIEGRLHEFLVTGTGRLLSMTAINMHSDVFDNVRQFLFYQDVPGKAIFRIVRKESYSEQDTIGISRELMKKLGDDMQLGIEFVDKIPQSQSGKYRFLEQKLPIQILESGHLEPQKDGPAIN